MFRTVEAVIDEHGNVRLLEPVELPVRRRALVTILEEETGQRDASRAVAEEVGESEWLYAAARNPAFNYLHDTQEDIYSPEDGKPFHDDKA